MKTKRMQDIVDRINQEGMISLSALCSEFSTSPATMRRDLSELEKRGLIERVRGGARSLVNKQEYEPPYSQRRGMMLDEKKAIAREAMGLIGSGDVVILDSSTTVCELAKLLTHSTLNITVITNDAEIAYILAPNPIIELIFVGGTIRPGFYTTIGLFAETMWKQLHADKLFLGVDAVDPRFGMLNYRIEEISGKRLMLECAKERIVLCDHTKFSTSAVLEICPLDAIDLLITDGALEDEAVQRFASTGLDIRRARL